MADKFEGYIAKLLKKEGTKKDGQRWFKHTFILTDGQNETPWIGTEFNAAFPATEGQYLRVEASPEQGKDGKTYFTMVKGSATVVKDPPARKSAQTAGGADVGSPTSTQKDARITYLNSRTAAIDVVFRAIDAKSFPLTKTDSKAGEATRYDQILKAIDKLTVRFFHDAETLRILDSVADEGAVADGDELPSVAETTTDDTGEFEGVDDDVSF